MNISYRFPSEAPTMISLVEAVGRDGFQAIHSIVTPFNRANNLGCLDWACR